MISIGRVDSEGPAMAGGGRTEAKVAVVIPCYRVAKQVLAVLEGVGPEVSRIYVVDDCCPEETGRLVVAKVNDPRVRVIFHEVNQGVGGATLSGFRAAVEESMAVVVKLDGDGQMDPALVPRLIRPILGGEADYTKGNRFYDPEGLTCMPWLRLLGNAVLSFFAKLSTGYWNIFDPNNGFIAADARLIARLPLHKIARRYFFESDMLFRLGTFRAKVLDMPMEACYGDEPSSLRISRTIPEFLFKHAKNFGKRFFYSYLLRDFNMATVGLLGGLPLVVFGVGFGLVKWHLSSSLGVAVTSGTVMLAALPIIVGVQLLLMFLNYDISTVPTRPISGDFDGAAPSYGVVCKPGSR